MEMTLDDLLKKVLVIASTPKSEFLRQLVNLIYNNVEEEYDLKPLSAEDLEAIRRGKEDFAQGRFISWDEFKEKHNL